MWLTGKLNRIITPVFKRSSTIAPTFQRCSMDETPVTPLSGTLVESPVHASPTWSMSDDHQSQQKPSADILAMPERLNDVPEWLRTPLYRFLRLKQSNWPAKTVQRSTRQLFSRLNHITTF